MNDHSPIRIATRRSALALAQARSVAAALGGRCELVPIVTRGDRHAGLLADAGGKGLFTAELESALRAGAVQLAVHSAKDVPADVSDECVIAAVPAREDPRDALVSPASAGLADLPAGARVGTASRRRACLLKAARPDVTVEPVRGNVDTRLRKLREGEIDAVVLAMAGLSRLGLTGELRGMAFPLPVEDFVPAAGQGALAVQCLAADRAARERLSAIDDALAAAAVSAERSVVAALGATCHSAVGVHLRPRGDGWEGLAFVGAAPGGETVRAAATGTDAAAVADALVDRLRSGGAARLLETLLP